jgi:hypothetical protein
MPKIISRLKIETIIGTERALVEEAIKLIHQGGETPMSLDLIELAGMGNTPPLDIVDALVDYMDKNNMSERFIAVLQRLGREVSSDAVSPALDPIAAASFDPENMQSFCHSASAYRCRILIGDDIKGSGVLVSHRLVLTAWHVVNEAQPWTASPRIDVMASDGKRYRARLAGPYSDCHPTEWTGANVDDADLEAHSDFVLLRLVEPIGYSLGHLALPTESCVWAGNTSCMLVHYPDGQDRGFTLGEVTYGGDKPRYEHTVPTAAGSSGGAAFSNGFQFIGLHQGRVGNHRRLVPASRYVNDNEFRACIGSDTKPTYLWSLNGSLDAHLIIGRQLFFRGLTALVEGNQSLFGIWIKRLDPQKDEAGLAFAYRMLENFLKLRSPSARAVRIDIPTDGEDLLELTLRLAEGDPSMLQARPGVRLDETTISAYERDRADALVSHLDQRDAPLWLYLEGPNQEFSRRTQYQLEQLIARMERARNIKVVMSRLESYNLPVMTHQSLPDVDAGRAGLLLDYVGDFSREDVRITATAIRDDLAPDLNDDVVEFIVDQSLAGVQDEFGRYSSVKLGIVSARLADLISPRVSAA